jgi:hypothetical protein
MLTTDDYIASNTFSACLTFSGLAGQDTKICAKRVFAVIDLYLIAGSGIPWMPFFFSQKNTLQMEGILGAKLFQQIN